MHFLSTRLTRLNIDGSSAAVDVRSKFVRSSLPMQQQQSDLKNFFAQPSPRLSAASSSPFAAPEDETIDRLMPFMRYSTTSFRSASSITFLFIPASSLLWFCASSSFIRASLRRLSRRAFSSCSSFFSESVGADLGFSGATLALPQTLLTMEMIQGSERMLGSTLRAIA